jgi:AraC family transcriptional regulator of adaptative response/methylated-DNA-[protein]-cysteine methyltransferase
MAEVLRANAADPRWAAVAARDWRADSDFVYAVTTTGVYCRPSCPSRRPKPANVRFYASAAEAERAGYRFCRRCDPREETTAPARAVERARQWIETHHAHPDSRVTLKSLARAVGMSPFHLQRLFKRFTGLTPREYLAARRTVALKAGLRERLNVTQAIFDAGYSSLSRVYEQVDARLGMTPGAYRRRAAGMRIAFDVVASPLGRLLVAATPRGLCRVAFGHRDDELERELSREFPEAILQRSPKSLRLWTAELLRRMDGEKPRLDLPLDVRATAFQSRVWTALRRIPPGVTRSYGEIAGALGRPKAARAVAKACASNPVAVVVPCHRVVRSDGGLGGYRWGINRKKRLLDREKRP